MSEKFKTWINSIENELFDSTSCPDFETLVAYHQQAASAETVQLIEKHIVECKLCSAVLEGFPNIENINAIENKVNRLRTRIETRTVADRPGVFAIIQLKKLANSISEKMSQMADYLRPVFRSPAFRLSSIALIILLALYIFSSTLFPHYISYATLSPEEKELLLLTNDRIRGKNAEIDEFSIGAEQLISAEKKTIFLFKTFDQTRVKLAIVHLKKAYHLSSEPFYQAKYAYFIGKAYLMRSDISTAKKWLKIVATSTKSFDYQNAANKILEQLNRENSKYKIKQDSNY